MVAGKDGWDTADAGGYYCINASRGTGPLRHGAPDHVSCHVQNIIVFRLRRNFIKTKSVV
jgi:hypothetical protein